MTVEFLFFNPMAFWSFRCQFKTMYFTGYLDIAFGKSEGFWGRNCQFCIWKKKTNLFFRMRKRTRSFGKTKKKNESLLPRLNEKKLSKLETGWKEWSPTRMPSWKNCSRNEQQISKRSWPITTKWLMNNAQPV